MLTTLFGIGHSVHHEDEFLRVAEGLDLIIDVRSHPTSKWEWWRQGDGGMDWIERGGIGLAWWPALGGWTKRHYNEWAEPMLARGVDLAAYSRGVFPKQRIGSSVRLEMQQEREGGKPMWTNRGLLDYAWYTITPEFQAALVELKALAETSRVAVMCCEALWWKCHRSMIADAMLYIHGVDLMHIKPTRPRRGDVSRWENHSRHLGDRLDRYPAEVMETWTEIRDEARRLAG